MPEAKRITPTQGRAIAALLTSRDVREAAKAVGVGPRTLYRWYALPEFQQALKAAETEALNSSIRRLADATGAAVDTLKAELENDKASPSARIRAADVILSRLLDLKQLTEIEARLSAIEAELKIGGRP